MSYWKVLDGRFLDRPTDWNALFGREAPLVFEIGFGRGDHLIHLAETNPDKNVVGIEISQPSLRKASGKSRTRKLKNLRILDGSGPGILWVNVLPSAIDEMHINFPDPWHKEAHHRRRLINPDFLDLVATRLSAEAYLYVATDHPDYQPVVTECLEQTPWFDSRLPTTYTTEDNTRFRTKYELKALREGRVPFYYKFKRNGKTPERTFALPEELPMPHAIVQAPLTIATVEEHFAPFQMAEQDNLFNIGFKGAYRSLNYSTLLVETYVRRSPQDQRIGLIIHEREPNEFIVKLHELGFPRSTDGVHFAVRCLATWLASLHDEARIVHHNLQQYQIRAETAEDSQQES